MKNTLFSLFTLLIVYHFVTASIVYTDMTNTYLNEGLTSVSINLDDSAVGEYLFDNSWGFPQVTFEANKTIALLVRFYGVL